MRLQQASILEGIFMSIDKCIMVVLPFCVFLFGQTEVHYWLAL